ncbi:hypothetical protein K438DRAFT_1760284 [Mycena galopus ATCC 62051]|nr:hypothetical protein K438DRAFT_1760284 [Mycena galopus ATCC 62051]
MSHVMSPRPRVRALHSHAIHLDFQAIVDNDMLGLLPHPSLHAALTRREPLPVATWGSRTGPKPGPFSLGRWSTLIGTVAVSWITFITIMLLFPPGQATTANSMISWITSAHKWFHGPVRNVDDPVEKRST